MPGRPLFQSGLPHLPPPVAGEDTGGGSHALTVPPIPTFPHTGECFKIASGIRSVEPAATLTTRRWGMLQASYATEPTEVDQVVCATAAVRARAESPRDAGVRRQHPRVERQLAARVR
jgi:hypothetical protein